MRAVAKSGVCTERDWPHAVEKFAQKRPEAAFNVRNSWGNGWGVIEA